MIARIFEKIAKMTGKTTRMDVAALLDHTLVHEFMHATKPNKAVDIGNDAGYGKYWSLSFSSAGSKIMEPAFHMS
jgi:hypothetical protein